MADHPDPYIGRLINDRFRVLQLVARGDTSRVYRAEQVPLGRAVALKVLDASYSQGGDPQFTQRFFLEASVASQLRHPNTVTVFDYGRTEDGTYFIAMEFVEGESLHDVLRRAGRFPPAAAAALAIQVARSAREAHQLGVVHRDLRPANVLVSRHGEDEMIVKVLGFGLVKPVDPRADEITQTGVFLGAPRYMSPEQIRGEPVDVRSDVYSLGVTLYELLEGRAPFEHATAVKVLMAHMHDPVPPLREDVPEALAKLVYACLQKRPEDRPGSMDEVIERLKRLGTSLTRRHTVLRSSTRVPRAPVQDTAAVRGSLRHAHSSAAGRPSLQTRRPGRGRGRLLRAAVVAGAMAAAAALAVYAPWAARPAEGPEGSRPVGGTDPSAVTSLPASEAPGRILIRVSSDPEGAEVRIDGRRYGVTPLEVELEGEAARRGRQVTFVLEREGYETARVKRTIRARRIEIHAALAERPSSAPRAEPTSE